VILGHFEKVPYSENDLRSIYHVRECEVWKLKQIAKPLDVVMSHDWPRGIVEHGNLQQLLRYKSFLRDEVSFLHVVEYQIFPIMLGIALDREQYFWLSWLD